MTSASRGGYSVSCSRVSVLRSSRHVFEQPQGDGPAVRVGAGGSTNRREELAVTGDAAGSTLDLAARAGERLTRSELLDRLDHAVGTAVGRRDRGHGLPGRSHGRREQLLGTTSGAGDIVPLATNVLRDSP
jgi:hypothetical protein